jgi:YqaJ-like viral recombinase domain
MGESVKIHSVEQNTLSWLKLHMGIPTASGLHNMLDTSFKLREGEMGKSYVHTKLAEAWRGKPLVELGSSGSFSTEQGMILEDEARPWLELEMGKKINAVGFITTDDGRAGCSPDGLIEGEECGVEIKCPQPASHVKHLLGGVIPKEYVVQVYASMFVTGYPRWLFISYRRGFPALIIMAQRDEEINAKIEGAVEKFHTDFKSGKARIQEIVEQNEKMKW